MSWPGKGMFHSILSGMALRRAAADRQDTARTGDPPRFRPGSIQVTALATAARRRAITAGVLIVHILWTRLLLRKILPFRRRRQLNPASDMLNTSDHIQAN
jgi:hypothetical protein